VKHHAVALGEMEQVVESGLRCSLLTCETQTDVLEPHGHVVCDTERATKVDVTLRKHIDGCERNVEHGGGGLHRDARTGNQAQSFAEAWFMGACC
jgi:hypothetical protein